MELPEGFISWLNKKLPKAQQFVDEEDFLDWAEGEDPDEVQSIIDRFNEAPLTEKKGDDDDVLYGNLSDDELDSIANGDDTLSDAKCKDIIEDDAKDGDSALYDKVMSWALLNYEPAKGKSEQEIGAMFTMDDDFGTQLATAYFDAHPEDNYLLDESSDEGADDSIGSTDDIMDALSTGDESGEEVDVDVSDEDEDIDDDTDTDTEADEDTDDSDTDSEEESDVDVSDTDDDGEADTIEVTTTKKSKKVSDDSADSTMRNIINTLVDRKFG